MFVGATELIATQANTIILWIMADPCSYIICHVDVLQKNKNANAHEKDSLLNSKNEDNWGGCGDEVNQIKRMMKEFRSRPINAI